MKSDPPVRKFEEVELKLALPATDPSELMRRLARSPPLARRKPTQQDLHNVYYDTPDQRLRAQRAALRSRRLGSGARAKWLQTLKTGDRGESALSQRGEWEVAVPRGALSLDALQDTPWASMDPDGGMFQQLVPAFVTAFRRTSWLVRRRDGSVVEVAFDVGQIVAGDRSAPICELEVELRAGPVSVLFDTARDLAARTPVLPLAASKAERGYALLAGTEGRPVRAQPVTLGPDMDLPEAAQLVLHEMLNQFTCNLAALRTSDDPEVVHQARVGWRRFRSTWRLFTLGAAPDAAASWEPLQPLLAALGELRDLDVAAIETLPGLADAYVGADAKRGQNWQALRKTLERAATAQRAAVRQALATPEVGLALLATAQSLEGLCGLPAKAAVPQEQAQIPLRRWARRRVDRLHERLKSGLGESASAEARHRARIMAKRLRYGLEALRPLLPRRRATRWLEQATRLQTALGASRDVVRAGALAARFNADAGLVEFLRGVAAGREALG